MHRIFRRQSYPKSILFPMVILKKNVGIQAHQYYKYIRFLGTRTYSSQSQKNHYEVLGVKPTASTLEIREAFLMLSKEFHPDINVNDPGNHQKFVVVNEAYTVLSKPLSRRDYDLTLQVERQYYNNHAPYRSYGYQADTAHYHYKNHAGWDAASPPPSQDQYHSGKRLHRLLVNFYTLTAFFTIGIVTFLLMNKEIIVPDVTKKTVQHKEITKQNFIMSSQQEGKTVFYYAVKDGNNPELSKVIAVQKQPSDEESNDIRVEQLNSV